MKKDMITKKKLDKHLKKCPLVPDKNSEIMALEFRLVSNNDLDIG